MNLKKLLSLVLSVSILSGTIPMLTTAYAEVLPVSTALATAPTVSGTSLILPEADDNSVISVFGSDNKQVIDIDGTVFTPLVDTKVNLILKAENGDSITKGTTNVSVTVPGKYSKAAGDNAKPATLPAIREWKGHTGDFVMSSSSKIIYIDASLEGKATQIQSFFSNMLGYNLDVVKGTAGDSGDILLVLDEDKADELGNEGYYIEIADCVTITAPSKIGILYGGTTMTQIMSQSGDKNTAPKGLIRDYPAYEVRSIMMDLGRPYYPIEFIESIGMYMSYYKMNEFHAHLNEGSFRVEVEAYDFLKAAKSWSKADYIAMEDRLLEWGVKVLNEIDTPGHSASFAGNNQDIPMIDASHLDIVSEENRLKSEIGIQRLYDEFIDGSWTNSDGTKETSSSGPIVKNNELHLGFDEYLHTKGQDAQIWKGYKQYTIDMLNYVTEKGVKAREWIFLGDSTNPDEFPAYTKEELASIKHPELITANIWIEQWGDAKLALDYGFNIVNSENVQLYFVPGVKGYWQNYPLADRFDNWEVTTYYASNENILKGHPQNRGASACLWFDKAAQETGYSYEDIFEQVKDMVMLISEKTWHGDKSIDQNGEEFEMRVEALGEYTPLANPGAKVPSASKKVAEYTFENGAADTSGNGYDAELTNVSVSEGAVTFNGVSGSYISLPFKKIGFPYTVSFDLTLTDYPANGETMNLFASEDGSERMYIDASGEIFYEGKGPCVDNAEKYRIYGYKIPLNQKVNLTLACESPENITTANAKIPQRYDISLIVNDSEEYTAQHTTATEYYSTRQSLQTAKIGEGLKGTIDNLLIYNVNAMQESLSEEDSLSEYAVNWVEDAYELEDISKFTAAGITSYGKGSIDTEEKYSGDGSLHLTNKKRYGELLVVNKTVKENTNYVMSFWIKSSSDRLSSIWLFSQKYFPTGMGYDSQLIINQNIAQNIKMTTDWQYVSIPVEIKDFHEGWTSDSSQVSFSLMPCHFDNNTIAAENVDDIWIDRISFRQIPETEYSINCTESVNSVNDAGKLVITNTYDSKYITAEGAKLVIDGIVAEDFVIKATPSLTQDKATAVIEYTGELSTGTHTVKVVMHDVWDKEITNTISDLSFVNYSDNLFSDITTCDETSNFKNGSMSYTNVGFDKEVYHSAPASISITDRGNYKEIMKVSAGTVDLSKKYVCTFWVKPDENENSDYRNGNNAAGVQFYLTYKSGSKTLYKPFKGVAFGESGTHWRKVSLIIDNADFISKNDTDNVLAGLEQAELLVLFSNYGCKSGGTQSVWIDDAEFYLLPEDGVMTPVCSDVSYEQEADGGLKVNYTFDSANVSAANEYATVDGAKTAAEITHSIVEGKSVVTVHFDDVAVSYGKHSIAISGLTDIWARTVTVDAADVFKLDHTINMVSSMYECDDITKFNKNGNATYEVDYDEYYSGGSSMKVTAKGYQELNKPYEYNIKNNTKHIYSFMIKTDGEQDRIYIYRDYWSKDGTTTNHTQFVTAYTLQKTTKWQRVTVEYCDDVPAVKGVLKTGRTFAAPVGGSPVRTYYIDCVSLRTVPDEGTMLSCLESTAYKYGGAEFVFDTEYVSADKIAVDGVEVEADISAEYKNGKTYITAVFKTPISEGSHTATLLNAEDLWQRPVAAEGTIITDNILCYVTDASKTIGENSIKINALLNTKLISKPAVAIVGIYEGEELVAVSIKDITLSQNTPVVLNETLQISDTDLSGLTAKVMCWDSVENAAPYMNVFEVIE